MLSACQWPLVNPESATRASQTQGLAVHLPQVRVYNYDNQHSIAITHLDDDPLCCSMHPSGNQILVGVHSSLRLYSIALVSCRLCKGGD